MKLSIFQNDKNLFEAASQFFKEELQIPVNTISEYSIAPREILGDSFKAHLPSHQLLKDIWLIGLVNDEAFRREKSDESMDSLKNKSDDYDGLLIVAAELFSRENGQNPTRSQLAEIVRAFNREFKTMPVTVLFRYDGQLAIANAERMKYQQQWREGEKVGAISLLKDISILNTHQGHKRILNSLAVEKMREFDPRNKVENYKGLLKGWLAVFRTEVLNKQFYLDYNRLSVAMIRQINPQQIDNKLNAHQGVLNLLNRILFIYFIQKKGWLMNDPEFIWHFWLDYQSSGQKDNFHKGWLNPLFFSAFNGKAFNELHLYKILPVKYHQAFISFPYLNGGLFTKHDDYDSFILEDLYFAEIFNYLQSYIFTIKEDTADDINLEINPELLGKMYEGMINATDLDDVDAENGIVYTERPEINFMTRRSFVEVLDKKLNDGKIKYSRDFIYHFCFDSPAERQA
ncbi:MAG TPA: hypothetical protein ENN84_04065, partial [Candidatus Marinimicrobia bacterium]|nr:hypothetical protein [Candidatus Neomarinimicrobiota bacterium]